MSTDPATAERIRRIARELRKTLRYIDIDRYDTDEEWEEVVQTVLKIAGQVG